MRFEESRKRSILSTSSSETVGRVDGFVVDVDGARVRGVRVGRGDGDVLDWQDVRAFGPDAVTVDDDGLVHAARADDGLDQPDLVGSQVLDTHGALQGVVSDVEFDPEDGRLRYLLTERGELDAARLRGVGPYAVVIAATGSDD